MSSWLFISFRRQLHISSFCLYTFSLKGKITVTAVAAYNTYHAKSSSVGFVVEFDGIKLYHAGDTGLIIDMADLANQHITYMFLPMDGIYTMSPEEAKQAAAMIQAKCDIPIHTMPPTDTYSDAIVTRFTSPHKLLVKPGATIELNTTATPIEKSTIPPENFRLEQNYPNPFNPSTSIEFNLPSKSFVSLKIFDLTGRETATLVFEELSVGHYSRQWNAAEIPSGIYFYRLQAASSFITKKLVL